ncbi:MAG: flavin reductase family protein [Bacteroidetes bacterium]|nr:flavin reductase family protein [Bacteroidota bacterium]
MKSQRTEYLEGQGVDIARFLEGMRHVPTVVTVVTMADESGDWGITIGSFVSLSLDPPLICFNVQKSIAIHDAIVKAEHFVVHVLREDQADLSDLFARSDISKDEQFSTIEYDVSEQGSPVLKDALTTFHCIQYNILPGGDHTILIGLVIDISNGKPGRPVVYHQRAYHGIGRHIADHY